VSGVSLGSLAGLVRARVRGDFEVDEFGADEALVDLLDPVVSPFLRVNVEGAAHVPSTGPAVLVANRRLGAAEPFVLLRGLRRATGRRSRFLGIPDIAPVGPALRRLGGAVNRPDELASLLRAGHLVALPLGPGLRKPLRAGALAPEAVAPALAMDVPVLPVAIMGGELTGRWQVVVGEPVRRPTSRGPLALAEWAHAARAGVQALLDEAFPPRWPFS
jgi:1-acyl-sn-glycerol-3-phosphate acyltransferase